ncbi:MAG: exosortase/archaeosortase family protein [Planctomycetota bacterium]
MGQVELPLSVGNRFNESMKNQQEPSTPAKPRVNLVALPWLLLPLTLLWTYSSVFFRLIHTWTTDPDYSHGFLVLPVALYIAWSRRSSRPALEGPAVGSLGLIGISLVVWLAGVVFNIPPLEEFSLLGSIAGVLWLLGGKKFLVWSLPSVFYLVFMIPLPYTLAVARAAQLQRFAAASAAYLLQACGIPALADGNVIQLERETLDVAYACSGLQMMIAFLAVTTAIAFLSNYRWLGKMLLSLSAIPIAIACNTLRILITAIGFQIFPSEAVRLFVHDFGGLFFIPLAIGLAYLEIHLFERSFPRRSSASSPLRTTQSS